MRAITNDAARIGKALRALRLRLCCRHLLEHASSCRLERRDHHRLSGVHTNVCRRY